ncbi:MAG TPA: hypothetical protein VMW34_11290, partial [Anaerolineales bacterium]|nr:hypothetical protein [Anaerolineales bacterium]
MSREILLAGIWFGLLTGLIEGVALFALKRFEILRGPVTFLGMSVETLWVSPLFDLLLFFGLGLLFSLLAVLLKRLPIKRLSIL